ncbi:MAG: hypothetical protein AB7P12_18805 [Alphaproteobacteria bacterium]
MERFPAFAGPSSAFDAEDVPARSRYDRDASYALGLLPRLAEFEEQAMTTARARAQSDGGGLADRFDALFGGSVARVLNEAPTPEARAMTEVLAERPRQRAGERALAIEAVRRADHYRKVLDESIAATRAHIAADPDGAEDSFGDLLDGVTLAADGWLGHDEGERLARDLEGEFFREAAQRLIACDPADAAERLDAGLWGEHLASEERARLIDDARARAEARAQDQRRLDALMTENARIAEERYDEKRRYDAWRKRLTQAALAKPGLVGRAATRAVGGLFDAFRAVSAADGREPN